MGMDICFGLDTKEGFWKPSICQRERVLSAGDMSVCVRVCVLMSGATVEHKGLAKNMEKSVAEREREGERE